MFYRKRKDIILPESAISGTGRQTIKFKIKQEPRRLEWINLKLRVTTNGSAMTGAAFAGYAGIVREIRVVVDDVLGSRNAVQVSGMGLMGFMQQNVVNLDRQNQIAYASAGFPTSTTLEISFQIPLRHPLVSEPFGNVLSLPLSQRFTNKETILEVDLADLSAAADVFTTNVPSYAASEPILAEVLLREVPDSVTYIPSELRSDTVGFNSTSNVYYEFGSSGYLGQVLVQGLSADFADDTTRVGLLSTGGVYRLEYGRNIEMKTNQAFMVAQNDLSRVVYPDNAAAVITSATLQNRNFTGEAFFDFISDLPDSNAFSLNSVYPLDLDITGGDKLRLYFNDLANSAYKAHITAWKLLPKSRADLNALAANV